MLMLMPVTDPVPYGIVPLLMPYEIVAVRMNAIWYTVIITVPVPKYMEALLV